MRVLLLMNSFNLGRKNDKSFFPFCFNKFLNADNDIYAFVLENNIGIYLSLYIFAFVLENYIGIYLSLCMGVSIISAS